MSAKRKMKAREFDRRFDACESLVDLGVDLDTETRPVNIDLPAWVIHALDEEADRRGVARQSLMKMWIVDRIDDLKKSDKAG